MLTLHISGTLEERLNAAAEQAGERPEQVAERILLDSLDEAELPLTAEQINLLRQRAEALDRGEFVSQEKVERFLEDWQAELDARALESE